MKVSGTLFNVIGISGAGKDTTAEAMQQWLPQSTVMKWVQPTKTAIERAYGLEPGTLDDRELRQRPIDPSKGSFSYLDLLIAMANVKANSEMQFGLDMVKRQITETLVSGSHVILTDTRMPDEAAAIADIRDMGFQVVTIYVTGRGTELPSDEYLDRNRMLMQDRGVLEVLFYNYYSTTVELANNVLWKLDELQTLYGIRVFS